MFFTGILSPFLPFAIEIPGAERRKKGVSNTICKRSPDFTNGGIETVLPRIVSLGFIVRLDILPTVDLFLLYILVAFGLHFYGLSLNPILQ